MLTKKEASELCRFLQCARGSWRNSVSIECGVCPYHNPSCSGYLLTADWDGKPVLYPIDPLNAVTGESISRDECMGTLSRQAFDSLYSRLLLWSTDSDRQCGIRQMFQAQTDKPER